ncbi:MAG: hypothetical protein JO307_02640 [Bryobacterales bacterium]|nr:hypothetical protein [Bryobacterales bacterium]MBV9396566.1 hypothetical protein [Bryobacterales bacterium]
MDTRTKIVPCSEALRIAAAGATVVTGYFDPMVAFHADRLQELKKPGAPLLVVIADPANPILPTRARAELAAALRVVDYVGEGAFDIEPDYCLEQEHERRLEELVADVHARQHVLGS